MRENYESLELDHIKQEMERFCSFSLGIKEIERASPSFDYLYVKRDLRRTYEAIQCVVRFGTMPFTGIHDLQEPIQHAMKNRIIGPRELRQCAEHERACVSIQTYIKGIDSECGALSELTESLNIDLTLAEAIEKCISVNYEVMDNASVTLKSIRKNIKSYESKLNELTQKFIQANASKLMDTITTTRNDRVCVLVKISEKNAIKGFIHGESSSGQTAYVEPECLFNANNQLQAAHNAEQEEIEKILFELSQAVKKQGSALLSNLQTLGILDGIFAKASWAKAHNATVAQIDEQGQRLYFKRARHPLIDEKKVISNTYEISSPKRVLLITGSNTGGKTVTLKTVGLFVLMSMCGFPITCEEAFLPMFDQIFVDIGDEQSIEQSLSTFSGHLSKLALICEKATSKSLILLDELGSGTDPNEGEALAIAVLDYLRDMNSMIVATTHYSKLKQYGSKHPDILLSSVEFDVEAMRPTYRYIEGLSGKSNAFEIARRFNLNEKIVRNAIKFKEENKTDQERLMEKLESTIEENMFLKSSLETQKAEFNEEKEKFDTMKSRFLANQQRLIEEAQVEAYSIVEEAKEKSQEVILELKELGQGAKPHELLEVRAKLNEVVAEVKSVEPTIETFAEGDYVLVKQYNYYGDVLEVSNKAITVYANGIKMKLKAEDITKVKKQVQKKPKTSFAKSLRQSFSLECNVIGEHVNDALAIVDKYLDNAILANVHNVRLVHGHGTGALRTAIHAYLKRNSNVEEFRMGGQGEGGLGATVVTLKSKGKKKNGLGLD